MHELSRIDNDNINDRIQISGIQAHTRTPTKVAPSAPGFCSPCTSFCKQKKKQSQGRRRSEREGRSTGRKGRKWVSVFILLSLFHRGAPIDRSSAQIRQQMLELTVSFNRGRKAQQATSRALYFISSSLHPSAFSKLPASPLKPL